MRDLFFVFITLAFFALMLAYVRGCARLGEGGGDTGGSSR